MFILWLAAVLVYPGPSLPLPTGETTALDSPGAVVQFPEGLHVYELRLDVETADGNRYTTGELKVNQDDHKAARDLILRQLRGSGFVVEPRGRDVLVVRGVKRDDGMIPPITRCKLAIRNPRNVVPTLAAEGPVKVESDVPK